MWVKLWERWEKFAKKWRFPRGEFFVLDFTHCFSREIRRVFNVDFHIISTIFVNFVIFGRLAIDFLLDFFDLVAEDEVEFEVGLDFFDTMHDGSVVFDANFEGDFGRA